MSFDILHDAEKGIAAIIDPELGRALGPTAMGESAVDILEKFAGTFVGDITKHPPSEVERKFEEFVLALSDIQDAVEGKPAEGEVKESAVAADPPKEAGSHADVALPSDPNPSPEAQAGPTGDTSPTVGGDAPPPAPANADVPTPVKTPQPGNQICPTCDGWRTIAQGEAEVECPTCKGAGEILGEQAEPGAGPGQQPA